jgi:hypothetical protein
MWRVSSESDSILKVARAILIVSKQILKAIALALRII